MKNRALKDEEMKKEKRMSTSKKKNMKRIGGGGLSLDAFANAKSSNSHYNPALIKKQREFYKNAKQVKKFKKLMQRSQHNNMGTSNENGNRTEGKSEIDKSKQKNSRFSLNEVYGKKLEEKEKARMEREAIIQAKKEKFQSAEAQRKAMKAKMFKRTRTGQPVMKYRIEHILETIQSSASSSADK